MEMWKLDFILGAMAYVESGGNEFAVRFEPAFFERLRSNKEDRVVKFFEEKYVYYISEDTIRAILATSFGILQILGYNIVRMDLEEGYVRDYRRFFEYFTMLDTQVRYFKRFVKVHRIDIERVYKAIREGIKSEEFWHFCQLWNGSRVYGFKLINAYRVHGEDAIRDMGAKLRYLYEEMES